jgi:hypothetical protein
MKEIYSVGIVCLLVLCSLGHLANCTSTNENDNVGSLTDSLNPIWYKTWGKNERDLGFDIVTDGTYLYVAGTTNYSGGNRSDSFLL